MYYIHICIYMCIHVYMCVNIRVYRYTYVHTYLLVWNVWLWANLFNTLQHTATHYSILQHTTTLCNTLQYTAPHCNMLQHAATHCNTLQHAATRCNTLQFAIYNTMQDTARHCKTLQQRVNRTCLASVTSCPTNVTVDAHCVDFEKCVAFSSKSTTFLLDFSSKRPAVRVLQCVVVCCSRLQCVAVCSATDPPPSCWISRGGKNVLRFVWCSVLPCVAMNVAVCVAVCAAICVAVSQQHICDLFVRFRVNSPCYTTQKSNEPIIHQKRPKKEPYIHQKRQTKTTCKTAQQASKETNKRDIQKSPACIRKRPTSALVAGEIHQKRPTKEPYIHQKRQDNLSWQHVECRDIWVKVQYICQKSLRHIKKDQHLQCVAVCCSMLQCVVVCCSVLQCVAVCCSVLQCVAVCCSVYL